MVEYRTTNIMILVDYSSISLSVVFAQGLRTLDEDLLRHMILNSLRMYNVKHRSEYGRMILACDSASWRKNHFTQYKASRKKARDASDGDWDSIYETLNIVTSEIEEHMPYPMLRVDGAEADDIIATLVESTQEFGQHEPVLIISGDKDFIQLQRYNNVKQFSPMQKKFVTDTRNPEKYLFEHVCRGDSSDGVPNILSADDSFVTEGARQTPLRQKKLDEFYSAYKKGDDLSAVMDANTYRNYCRNQTLINLSNIPKDILDQIVETYQNTPLKSNTKVLNYLISKRCSQLVACAEEFFIK